MAVARFILASVAILSLVSAQSINCDSAKTTPINSMNYFAPSQECRDANADVGACYTQWGQCINSTSDCTDLNICLSAVLVCLDNIPNPAEVNASSPCHAWNESFTTVKAYLNMGGAYEGSGLQTACTYAACSYIASAPTLGDGNTTCAVPLTTCATAPKAPAKIILTFGGSWAAILASDTTAIESALQKGIARLLSLSEWFIRILGSKSGSLIVEFAVLDTTVDGAGITSKLQQAVGSDSLSTTFTELLTVSGLGSINIESVAAADGSSTTFVPALSPRPDTPAPANPMPANPPPANPTPSTSSSCYSPTPEGALPMPSGSILSDSDGWGGFPYRNSNDCTWTFECPAGTVFSLQFPGSARLYDSGDTFVVRPSGSGGSGLVDWYRTFDAFVAALNALEMPAGTVTFRTNSWGTSTGFTANYMCRKPAQPTPPAAPAPYSPYYPTSPAPGASYRNYGAGIAGSEGGLSAGATAGIAVGAVAFAIIIVGIVGFILYRRKKGTSADNDPTSSQPSESTKAR